MEQKRGGGGSKEVANVGARIEGWRKTRKERCRMPEELWRAAAEVARVHGVNPIAEALHLDYYALKRRVDGVAEKGSVRRPVFVELGSPAPLAASACVVEIVRPDGAKMTIRMAGDGDGKLVPLGEAFWGARA